MSRKDAVWAVGGPVLGVAIAVGVVLARWDRAREEAPPIRVGPPPTPGGADRLSAAAAELSARLDAQEKLVVRAEDRALPAAARLEAVTAALAAGERVDAALDGALREVKAFVPAPGAEADRGRELALRLKAMSDRSGRLTGRRQAVVAQLAETERKTGKE
jgi:hypothetical protein